jgi:hypothetical protein
MQFQSEGVSIYKSRFEEVFDKVKLEVNEKKYTLLVQHIGYISDDLINGLADVLEDQLQSFGEEKIKIKRVFSIFIEGSRNIRSHGAKDNDGIQKGFFIVAKSAVSYKLIFSNIIVSEQVPLVEKYMEAINNADIESLKILHQSSLLRMVTPEIEMESSGGLGLLLMRMRASSNLTLNIEKYNELKSLLVVEVSV